MSLLRHRRGAPLHLHRTFFVQALDCFIADLVALGTVEFPKETCDKIADVLSEIRDIYDALGENSLITRKLRPELSALRVHYKEWNDAQETDPVDVAGRRRSRIQYMRTRRKSITEQFGKHSTIFQPELTIESGVVLYQTLNQLPKPDDYFPKTVRHLKLAHRRFLPGATHPGSRRAKSSGPELTDVPRAFILVVRKALKVRASYLENQKVGSPAGAISIREWGEKFAQEHLVQLSPDGFRAFAAAFSRQYLPTEMRLKTADINTVALRALESVKSQQRLF